MANMFDYIAWRGDLTFEQSEFNDIDNLILAELSYIDFEGIVPSIKSKRAVTLLETAKFYKMRGGTDYLGKMVPSDIVKLLYSVAQSDRFKDVLLSGYINQINIENQEQFSATTFFLPDNTMYVAFRGTDDTIVGWKENFNMSFMMPVPSQNEAVKYLNNIGSMYDIQIRVGGHSKGGNLAVYAAVNADESIKQRLVSVYSNDGPGFTCKMIEDSKYIDISGKIKTIVPKSSVVGMLLEHEEKYIVVDSSKGGVFQHDAFTWEILGKKFIVLDGTSDESKEVDKAIKDWIQGMSREERIRFVDTMFEVINPENFKTVTELNSIKFKTANNALRSLSALDENTKKAISRIITALFKDSAKTLKQSIFEKERR